MNEFVFVNFKWFWDTSIQNHFVQDIHVLQLNATEEKVHRLYDGIHLRIFTRLAQHSIKVSRCWLVRSFRPWTIPPT